MKKNFVKSRWLFTMLLFVTTMIMPSMMWAKSITPTRPTIGDGKTEPYQIGTAAELYWFAGLVNGTLTGVEKDASANAKLMNNITVNEGVLDANKDLVSGKDFIPWTPIGTSDVPYTGTFDGKGYTISGLYFNNPTSYYVGLFGCIGANGKISNVGVLDSYFQFSARGGGVCGMNKNGELQNCSNSSTVICNMQDGTGGVCGYNSKGTVRDCKNTGSVRGKATLGGVCGVNSYGTITNCFNEGAVSVTVTSANVGGVCGNNYSGTIKCSYNTASVSGQSYVGGVSGANYYGTITNCFNKGTVSGQEYFGGVCGAKYGGTITNCYYLSDTAIGGINGKDVSGKVEGKSIEKFESGEVAYLLAEAEGKGLGEQVWGQHLGIDEYPVPGSAYKVIKAAQGDKDANGHYTYWATFSNLKNDVTLSVSSDRKLYVYNATVSGGKMTLTQRNDYQVAKEEGVLLKTNGEYVNAKANETNGLPTVSYNENNLVATPPNASTVRADDYYILYRLTYNNATSKLGLGFYLSLDKNSPGPAGMYLKATPGKAYLKVHQDEVKAPSSEALTRSFVFGGGSETTGIDGITIMGTDVQRHGTVEGIFDLQGRKIVNPTKGIYIKNNKKVIIR